MFKLRVVGASKSAWSKARWSDALVGPPALQVNHILTVNHGKKVAVIENEFGERACHISGAAACSSLRCPFAHMHAVGGRLPSDLLWGAGD